MPGVGYTLLLLVITLSADESWHESPSLSLVGEPVLVESGVRLRSVVDGHMPLRVGCNVEGLMLEEGERRCPDAPGRGEHPMSCGHTLGEAS